MAHDAPPHEEPLPPPPVTLGGATLHNVDCLAWMRARAPSSIHAVVTDPPYGMREFNEVQKAKLRAGHGGVWRIPPELDGCKRSPLPRFTTLTPLDHQAMRDFFLAWARLVLHVLVPGGHVLIAGNPLISHLVYLPMLEAGFEKRGEIIRLVRNEEAGGEASGDLAATEVPVPQQAVFEARAAVHRIHVADAIEQYIVDLLFATRYPERYDGDLRKWIQVGASPRGGLALDRCSRAHAFLRGRDHVTPDDVRAVLHDCLRHRLMLTYQATAEGVSADHVLAELVKRVAVA